MFRIVTISIALFLGSLLSAQTSQTPPSGQPAWIQLLYAPSPEVEAVSEAFRQYYAEHPFVKNEHTQYFKRWLREVETYEYQNRGDHLTPSERRAFEQAEIDYLRQRKVASINRSLNDNWTSVGPYDWDHDAAGRSYAPGAAHVYTIEHCQGSPDILYAGTATAGLWRSTDRGGSWDNITKDLMANSVYAVESHPTNTQEVLAAMMGGIFSSKNAGASWTETGDAAFQSVNLSVRDIKYHQGSTSVVWAATNNGLFRSTNQGSSWTEMMSGNFQEIEFHPSNNNIIYVIRQPGDETEFWKSVDGGNTFTQQTTGWPVPTGSAHNRRAEIAVSPAAPNKVVALLTGSVNGGSGLYGVYISNDAGASWIFQCCGPQPGGAPSTTNINMMGWSDVGTDDGGQYYYDLALAVSPTDADKIFVGAVNMWVSEDGGATFTCPAKWSHPHKPNYVHADIHDINFYPNGDLFVANDGGIFYSNDSGDNFTRSITGILGSDFWGFGVGNNNDQLMLGGAYHNGTLIRNGDVYLNEWACMDGGDGVGGAVNPFFNNRVYSDRNIKTMPSSRTVAPATRGYALSPSWSYRLQDFSQIEWAADNYNVHYLGRDNGLYKTEDDNRTVTLIHDFGEAVSDVEVAWSDPQVMYVATKGNGGRRLYRSGDGGMSWTDITPASTASSSRPYDVAVSYENPDLIWVARLGTSSGTRVFRSDNGGQSYTDITSGPLSGESLTNIIVQRSANDQLYVGTTRSVFTGANGGSSWELYATGLPASTRSRQLAISYRTNKLYNATNRSVWVSDLATTSSPQPQVSVDKYFSACSRDTFKFADNSTVGLNGPFSWSFPGASWVSSTSERNPRVIYEVPGIYDVSLTVGGQTQTLNDFIEVSNGCAPEAQSGNSLVCSDVNDHLLSNTDPIGSSNTLTLMAWIKPDGIQNGYTGIIFSDDASAGLNFRENNALGYHWPGGSTHWAWTSNLEVPANEWSFVAMVVEPNAITFYVNEKEITRNVSLSPIGFGNFRVGSYRDWDSRNFKGEIDEVAIWDRSLTRDEIRLWRHLTLERQATPGDPLHDPNLKVYLQFNETSGQAYDRVGINHGTLRGSAGRTLSSAPIGGGSSSKQIINTAGAYNYPDEDIEVTFSAGDLPGNEVVVTHLQNAPFIAPGNVIHTDDYWIINNYGQANFSELASIRFTGFNGITAAEQQNPEQFILYKRSSNAAEDDWGAFIDQADAAEAGNALTFSTGNSITSFSQFVIGQDESLIVLPVLFSAFTVSHRGSEDVALNWFTATEEDADFFVVEHSTNGTTFSELARQPATNNNSGSGYEYVHRKAPEGRNFYRIRSVDLEAHEDLTGIRSIVIQGTERWAMAYPNPLSAPGGLQLKSASEEATVFELFDAQGRIIRQTTFTTTAYLRLPDLSPGTYTYRMVSAGQQLTGRLVKAD